MKDEACVEFLKWALPQMQLRWHGFRRVRKQVCKRIGRRIVELGLADVTEYRDYLQSHVVEWQVLSTLCRVTISRFYRDKDVFNRLSVTLIPHLCDNLRLQRQKELRCWSAGCARGEEAYSLAMLWRLILQDRYPEITVAVTATDIDPDMIRQAQKACYAFSSLRNVSPHWRQIAFEQSEDQYCLRQIYRNSVAFQLGDVENVAFDQPYHLVCCRNLVFTYFNPERQVRFLSKLQQLMPVGGVLVLGAHETLPENVHGWRCWRQGTPIFLRE